MRKFITALLFSLLLSAGFVAATTTTASADTCGSLVSPSKFSAGPHGWGVTTTLWYKRCDNPGSVDYNIVTKYKVSVIGPGAAYPYQTFYLNPNVLGDGSNYWNPGSKGPYDSRVGQVDVQATWLAPNDTKVFRDDASSAKCIATVIAEYGVGGNLSNWGSPSQCMTFV